MINSKFPGVTISQPAIYSPLADAKKLMGSAISQTLAIQAKTQMDTLQHYLESRELDNIRFPYVNGITKEDMMFVTESVEAFQILYNVFRQCAAHGIHI